MSPAEKKYLGGTTAHLVILDDALDLVSCIRK